MASEDTDRQFSIATPGMQEALAGSAGEASYDEAFGPNEVSVPYLTAPARAKTTSAKGSK
jgi:hypothetical protein